MLNSDKITFLKVKKSKLCGFLNSEEMQLTSTLTPKERRQVESRQITPRNTQQHKSSSNYDKFKAKYSNIDKTINSFNSIDFVYLFKEISRECGYRYFISNINKDAHIFKKLLEEYRAEEIYLMISFLFKSNQKYLDKRTLSPNVLASAWCNKIYYDSIDYKQGLYIDMSDRNATNKKSCNSKSRQEQLKRREWSADKKSCKKKKEIGDWD